MFEIIFFSVLFGYFSPLYLLYLSMKENGGVNGFDDISLLIFTSLFSWLMAIPIFLSEPIKFEIFKTNETKDRWRGY